MKPILIRLTPILAILLLAACATAPKGPPPEIVRLQQEIGRLRADPRIAANASDELDNAQAAIDVMATDGRRLDEPMFRHGIYLADRLVQTAEAMGLARYAEQRGNELGAERDRLLVDVRTRQAEQARREASVAQAAAESEHRRAEIARADANAALTELAAMQSRLTELQTAETERGLVVTLGDVLFEVDRAAIKPGATRALDQLSRVLADDPDAHITIEGHTDSTGSRDYNLDLSKRRADVVRAYLVTHGVDPSRITVRGLGQEYPVASNDTEAGRQQNRRVEVIIDSSVAR